MVMTKCEEKKIVLRFLRQCNEYSDREIDRNAEKIKSGENIEAICGKIQKWLAYREFNERAISEVESGELDDWFVGSKVAN